MPPPRQARLFDADDYAGPLFEKRARRVAVAPERHERMAWGLADLARSTGHTDQDVPTAVAVAVLVYHVYLRERTDRLEAAFEGRPVPNQPEPFDPHSWDLRSWVVEDNPHIPVLEDLVRPLRGTRYGAVLDVVEEPVRRLHHRLLARAFQLVYDLTGGLEEELAAPGGAVAAFFETVLDQVAGRAARTIRSEFYTPRPLLDLLVRLVDPRPGETVYDPCFGSGGFLAAAARYANLRHRASEPIRVAGTDVNAATLPIACARVVLAGADPSRLQHRDAFDPAGDWYQDARTGLYDRLDETPGTFDVVLVDPPWGLRVPRDEGGRFPVQAATSDLLFLQLAMELLRPGGRAAVIVPEGVLYKSGAAQEVRKRLLHAFRLDAVLALPQDAYAASSVRANVLVFSRREPLPDVWFVSDKLLNFANDDTREAAAAQAILADGVAVRRGDKPAEVLQTHTEGASSALAPYARGIASSVNPQEWFRRPLSAGDESPLRVTELIAATAVAGALASHEEAGKATSTPGSLSWTTPIHELAERDYELVVKPSGEEALDELFTLIREGGALGDRPIRPLGSLFEVFGGAAYRREDLLSAGSSPSEDAPPFIRIRDLDDGTIGTSDTAFAPEAAGRINPRLRLQRTDLLVSLTGTVGKVAAVPERLVGAIPALDLAVLRVGEGGEVGVPYVAALLRTAPYQAWLTGHARGSVIQRLSLKDLRRLPIPVLPPEDQLRVAAYATPGASAARLGLLFSEAEVAPATAFIEGNPRVSLFIEALAGGDTEQRVFQARRLARELEAELARTEVRYGEDSELARSVYALVDPLRDYADALEHFHGADRFALLGAAEAALRALGGNEPAEASGRVEEPDADLVNAEFRQRAALRLVGLVRTFRQAIEEARTALLESSSVEATLEPAAFAVAERADAQLHIRNTGALPLRRLRVRLPAEQASLGRQAKVSVTLTAGGEVSVTDVEEVLPALAAGEEVAYPVSFPALQSGSHALTVEIRAVRFDQEPFLQRTEAPYEVQSIRQVAFEPRDAFGPSPYILGSEPVRDLSMFFGRQRELAQIYDYVNRPGQANIVILEGTRRSGKSSVLRYLEADPQRRIPGWVPVYCSFQSARGRRGEDQAERGIPTEQVFRTLALRIALAMHRDGVEPDFPDTPPYQGAPQYFRRHARKAVERLFAEAGPQAFDVLQELLAVWLDQLGQRRVLLLLDEFDKIDEGIRNGITGPEVPENLRALFQEESRLNAVLAVFPRIVSLRQSYWSVLFGLGKTVPLRPLGLDEATALITEPVRGRLVYEAGSAKHLAELAGRHPFIVQVLADQVFSLCKQTEQRTVTRRIVAEAAQALITDNEHFEAVWHEIQLNRRRAILALLNRLSRRGASTTLQALEAEIEARGLRLSRGESLGAAHLDALREMELVQRDNPKEGPTTYRLAIPLMGEWIERHDLDDLLERARLEVA